MWLECHAVRWMRLAHELKCKGEWFWMLSDVPKHNRSCTFVPVQCNLIITQLWQMLFVIKIKPAVNKYGEWLSSWFSGRKSGTSMHKCSLLSFNIIASHGYAIMRKRVEVSYTLGEGSLWDTVGFSVHIVLYASNVQKPSYTHFFHKARFAACTAICMWHSHEVMFPYHSPQV